MNRLLEDWPIVEGHTYRQRDGSREAKVHTVAASGTWVTYKFTTRKLDARRGRKLQTCTPHQFRERFVRPAE